ncbi:MAG: hypothetical protein V3S73_04460 [Gammaproteobacteria bacterium]
MLRPRILVFRLVQILFQHGALLPGDGLILKAAADQISRYQSFNEQFSFLLAYARKGNDA